MIHPPVETRVVGSSIKAETKNPEHTTRDNHRASPILVVQIQWDLMGALSPSGVRHTYRLPPYYTHSSCKRAGDSVQRQLYKGKKTWGACEMGQPRARAITGEAQACWRLPYWSNPKDDTISIIYLYIQTSVRAFFTDTYI